MGTGSGPGVGAAVWLLQAVEDPEAPVSAETVAPGTLEWAAALQQVLEVVGADADADSDSGDECADGAAGTVPSASGCVSFGIFQLCSRRWPQGLWLSDMNMMPL